jgi:hypothetical protein
MNTINDAYHAGVAACLEKNAGILRSALRKVHAPAHFGAHQAVHKKVHHAVVPGEKKKMEKRAVGASALAVQGITAPVWGPMVLGSRAIEDGQSGKGGALIGAPIGALGGAAAGGLLGKGGGKRALMGAGLGMLGGAGLGYGIGKPFED